MVGTRGVPAAYGGFETAIEEIGRRLADLGHEVVVYCRGGSGGPTEHLGMELVQLPAARRKSLETLSHTGLSVLHLLKGRRPDATFVFNAANAPFLPLLRLRRIPVAVHVDGLEWRRAKWSGLGQRYYRAVESLSVRWGDALIADAQGIADYYSEEFGATTELIVYGAPRLDRPRLDRLAEMNLAETGYHLVVARFEPENHVLEIVEGYRRSTARLPLVVVGSAPYSDQYTAAVESAARGDDRIRLVGGVWDQELLDALYAGCASYLHGHSVGGTNPSLLRAIGAGAPVIAWDVPFNAESIGDDGLYFSDTGEVAAAVTAVELDVSATAAVALGRRDRVARRYNWDDVTQDYLRLARSLAGGRTQRGLFSGRRRP